MQTPNTATKKHKKHKRDRHEVFGSGTERPPALKLILKVGGNSGTPEYGGESPSQAAAMLSQQYQQQLGLNYSVTQGDTAEYDKYGSHKKLKKKKKKKDKRHKHHHKDKKRRREEPNQDSVGNSDSNLQASERATNHETSTPSVPSSANGFQGSGAVSSGLSPHREPRTCVLRKIAERSPLQRLLEHLLRSMEKRDPQQFFAWPVTDNIAPGYSQIISNPMDFSTIKQKIDDNNYSNLKEFVGDFKLMCDNATTYNHPDTIYFKAAKKLLHVGFKMVTPDKLRQLKSVLTYMQDLTPEELGFELGNDDPNNTNVLVTEEQIEQEREQDERNEEAEELKKEARKKMRLANLGKFEAIPDDLTPQEILQQAQNAAKAAAEKLSAKNIGTKMGFLRQKKDGTTSLQIIVPGDGIIPGTNQRPVSLGQLVGKLSHGNGVLAGFREDRRNMSKPVKPLYYGPFGSYAPSYDSTFANLTKEETDLVYQTYGDETAVQYAESILDFAKDCDYTLTMVDDLLDILTNGDHRKTKKFLEEKQRLKDEEEKIKLLLEKPIQEANRNINSSLQQVKVDMDQLKTLQDLGINVNFLEALENEVKLSEDRETFQRRLDNNSNMLNNLKQIQHERLSGPLPAHLSNVPKAWDAEIALAEKITDNLVDISKKLPPSAIAPVDGLRRAMGIAPLGVPEQMQIDSSTQSNTSVTMADNTSIQQHNASDQEACTASLSMEMDIDNDRQQVVPPLPMVQMVMGHNHNSSFGSGAESSGVNDLESELREFLESDPNLGNSPLHDDKTLEDILSES